MRIATNLQMILAHNQVFCKLCFRIIIHRNLLNLSNYAPHSPKPLATFRLSAQHY